MYLVHIPQNQKLDNSAIKGTQWDDTRWCESKVCTNLWASNASDDFHHGWHVDSSVGPLGYVLHHVITSSFVHVLAINELLMNIIQIPRDDAQLQFKHRIIEHGSDELSIVVKCLPDQFQCFPCHRLLNQWVFTVICFIILVITENSLTVVGVRFWILLQKS